MCEVGRLGMYCRTGIGRGRNLGRNDCDCGHAVYVISVFFHGKFPITITHHEKLARQEQVVGPTRTTDKKGRRVTMNTVLWQKDQKKKLISPTQKVAKSTADKDISRQVAVFARTIDSRLRQIRQPRSRFRRISTVLTSSQPGQREDWNR